MTLLRSIRHQAALALFALLLLSSAASAQNIWTAGSTTDLDWNTAANWSTGVPLATDNVTFPFVIPNPGSLANPSVIALSTASVANNLNFLNNYTLSGAGSLNLTSGGVFTDYGASGSIAAMMTGTGGLTKTGYGTLFLTNGANDFTGTTTINGGSVSVNTPGALGLATSAIAVTGNSTRTSGLVYGGGGNLTYGGGYAGQTYSRNLDLNGSGPNADGSAFSSVGFNTISGNVTTGSANVASVITRITNAFGNTTYTGSVTIGANGQLLQFQGPGNSILTGPVTVTTGGILEKQGQTTSGGMSITGTITGAGEIRATNIYIRLAASGTAILAPNGGTFELRTDAPAASFNTSPVTLRNTGTIFVDHAVNSIGLINQQVAFGTMTIANNNQSNVFTSRNGFGHTFTGTHTIATGNTTTLNANSSGTTIYNVFSLNEGTARTLVLFGNGDQRVNGNFAGSTTAQGHNISKQGQGFLTLVGIAPTANWSGTTTISNGTLSIPKFSSLTTGGLTFGNATTSIGALVYTGTATTGAGETSAKAVTWNSTTGNAYIYANQTGTAPTALILNGAFTASLAGTKTFFLAGSSTLNNEIGWAFPATATINVQKAQLGTWVLSGANVHVGTTNVAGGTLVIQDTFSGGSRDVLPATAVGFNTVAIYQHAGGTLQYRGAAASGSTESTGALTPAAGEGKVVVTAGAGGTAALTFASLGTVSAGATVDIQPDASSVVNFLAGTEGFMNKAVFYQNTNYAYLNSAGPAFVRAPVYGTDLGFVDAAAALTAASHNNITGSFSNGAVAASSVRFDSAQTLTLTGTLTTSAILATNGSSTIDQGTGGAISTGGANELVIRVAGASDQLTLNVPIIAASTLGVSKSGLGTLVLAAINVQTTGGPFTINEGTVRMSGTGTMGAANTNVNIRQNGVLDLNGFSLTGAGRTLNSLNGSGLITNSAASGTASITVGNNNGASIFMGQINNGATASISVIKAGSGDFATNSAHTFSGPLTLNGGNWSTLNFANIGTASGIGRGDATSDATNAASLVFNGGNLRFFTNNVLFSMQNTPSISHNRLFTFQGNASIDSAPSFGGNVTSNAANNAAWIWANTGSPVFATAGAKTLTLQGNSTGDNEIRLLLTNNTVDSSTLSVTKAGAGLWHLSNAGNSYTGTTAVNVGTLQAQDGAGLPANSPLTLGATTNSGVFQTTGNFVRPLAATAVAGNGTVTWTGTTGGGGFSSGSAAKLVVSIGGLATPTTLVWGTGGFVPTGAALTLSSDVALGEVEFRNPIDTNGALRTVTVNDNTTTSFDFATLSGVISGTGGISKAGAGYLYLVGANTYTGDTALTNTSTFITSFGGTGSATSSLGAPGGRLLLGSGTTTTFVVYGGPGETSDRSVVLSGGVANMVIEASGSGPLVLTNVSRTAVGAGTGNATLFLRGYNSDNNMVTSVISNDIATGITTVTKDGGATWILTANNTYTGNTNFNGGLLGAGSDTAFGTGTMTFGNGTFFPFGGDRTFANNMTVNNATSVIVGSFNVTVNGTLQNTGGNSNLDNFLPAGKLLTFNGQVNLQDAANNRTFNMRGTGTTVFTGLVNNGGTANGGLNINGADGLVVMLANPTSGANNYTGTTTITRGTLFITGGGEQIPNGGTTGGFVMTPGAGANATLDLNGRTETVNAVTATSAGNTLITNTSASAASLVIGDNNGVVTIGAVTGTFTITNGLGALSLTKIGTGAATIGNTVVASYTGDTTANGGTLTINAPLTGTPALVAGGGTLNIVGGATTGTVTNVSASAGIVNINGASTFGNATIAATGTGSVNFNAPVTLGTTTLLTATGTGAINVSTNFTNPGSVLSVNVDGGATLGMAQALQLTPVTLNLGAGAGTATLNLGLGVNNLDSSHIYATGAATTANAVKFNITGLIGFGSSPTYDVLTATSGLDTAAYSIGLAPFGYTVTVGTVSPTLVRLNVVVGSPNTLYWTDVPTASFSWAANSGANFNWSTTADGLSTLTGTPGAATTVRFSANNATLTGGAITTTLDGSYSIDSLQFNANPVGVTSVTINPGTPAGSMLVIAPAVSTNGIAIDTTAGNVTISAAVQANAAQTWTVTDATSTLLMSGALTGTGNLTKSGAGAALVRNFTGYTGSLTLNAGTFGLQQQTVGNGVQVPFAGSISVGGDSTIDVTAPFVSTTASLGNQVTFSNFSIGTNTLTVTGGSNTTANATASTTSYSLRSTGTGTFTGTPTFVMGNSATTAAGFYMGGVVTASSATTVTVNAGASVPAAPLAFLNTANSFAAGSSFVVNANAVLEGRIDESGAASLGNHPIALTSSTLRVGANLSTPVTGTAGFSARYINVSASNTYSFSFLQPALATQQTGVINAPTATPFTPGAGMTANPAGLAATNTGIHFSGVLNITTPGYYGFSSASDDGTSLYLDGTMVLQNDGGHGFNGQAPWGTVFLSAGQHVIAQHFGQGTGGAGDVLSYTGPDTGNATVLVGSIAGSVISPSAMPAYAMTNAVSVTTGGRIEVAADTNMTSLMTLTNALTLTVTSNGLLGATLASTNTGSTVLNGNTVFNLLNAHLSFAGPIDQNVGPFNLQKNGWGNLTIGGSNYTGTTLIEAANFTSTGVITGAGAFTYGLTNTANGFGNVSFLDNAAYASMTWQAGRNTVTYGLNIASGKTLTVNGNFFVGSNIDAVSTNITTTGGGNLVVTGAAANVRVGVSTAGTDNGNGSIVDLTALASSSFTLGTGAFVVGFQGDNTASTNEVRLAPVSTITASALNVGASNIGGSAAVPANSVATITNSANLILGSTSNAITVDTLTIGNGNNRDQGQVKFNGAGGTVSINNAADTGTVFNMAANATGGGGTQTTGYIFINNFDVSGHNATLKFAATTIGNLTARVGNNFNFFSFDTGSLTMLNLTVSQKTGGTGTMSSTINLGGTGSTTITNGILLFSRVSGASTGATDAVLTVDGTASLNIGATSGDSIRMAESATAGRTATATLNFNGGTTTVSGHIIRVGGAGTTTATINLAGGTLIMNDQNIGTATVPINNFNFTAGTLRNLGSMFQNVTQSGGTIERTVAGTTSITGSYTASSTTSALVRLSDAGANFTTTGGLNVGSNATLRGVGQVNGNLNLNSGSTLRPGNSIGTLTIAPGAAGTVTVADGTTLHFEIADATTPAAPGTGGTSVGVFPALTSNSAFNQINGTISFPGGLTTAAITVVADGTGTSFTPFASYSYQVGAAAGNDLSGLNLTSSSLTLVPIGFVPYADYSLTGNAAGSIFLNFSVVPEPALLGFFAAAGLLFRRRTSK